MFTNFKRVVSFAWADFYRNKGISLAAIFILAITIFFVTGFFFVHGVSNAIIDQVQSKIDITAYFKPDVAESDILNAKDQLMQDSANIKSIEYVSKDQALQIFTQNHQDNPIFSNALNEVGDNPFLASLNITTNGNPSDYEKIATILQGDPYSNLIDQVDFSQKKAIINTVFSITSTINTYAIVLGVILMLVVIMVVFNTIKLAIEHSKEEINTMTIVGASSWFVRWPFIIQGAIFGAIAFLVCFIVTALVAGFISPGLMLVLSGFSVWNFFVSNIFWIILIQLGVGVALGVASSFIVVQRYLRV